MRHRYDRRAELRGAGRRAALGLLPFALGLACYGAGNKSIGFIMTYSGSMFALGCFWMLFLSYIGPWSVISFWAVVACAGVEFWMRGEQISSGVGNVVLLIVIVAHVAAMNVESKRR